MRILRLTLILLGFALSLLLLVTAFLPSELTIKREVVVTTPSNYPFELIQNLKSWGQWFPLLKLDHNINIYYNHSKPNSLFWISNHPNVGKGSIELIKKIPKKLILANINLQNDKSGKLLFKITQGTNYCSLKMQFSTQMTFFEKWMGFFLDTVVGPTLEKSIEEIKSISEYLYFKENN